MDLHLHHLLLPLLSVCLLSCSGTTSGQTVVKVNVGSEAVLPCFIKPKRDITQVVFDWKKDGQEVFFHDNQGHNRQGEEFRGRVFHFPEQLQSGNASIVIRKTIMDDSGTYTCEFSPGQSDSQMFTIELVVDACPTPHLVSNDQSKDMRQLTCKVQGVSPKPKVELKDSSGNNLHAEETLVPKTGGSYDIILQTTVTKTDNYSCVVTQEEICHQVSKKISMHFPGSNTGLVAAVVALSIILLVVLLAVLYWCHKIGNFNKGSQTKTERDEEKNFGELDKLKKKSDTSGV